MNDFAITDRMRKSWIFRSAPLFPPLLCHCQSQIRSMRSSFISEANRIKNPAVREQHWGKYTPHDCWKAYADDDFIAVVENLSNLLELDISSAELPDFSKPQSEAS